MEFSIKVAPPEQIKTDCLVVGAYDGGQLSAAAAALDKATDKQLRALASAGDLPGKLGTTLMLRDLPGVAARRVLVVGLGKESEFGAKQFREAVRASMRALGQTGAAEAATCFAELNVTKRDLAWKAEHIALVAEEAAYRFEKFKSKNDKPARALRALELLLTERRDHRQAESGIKHGAAIAAGINLAKDLGNTPPNVCTPSYLAAQARELAKAHGLKLEVLDQADMEKLKMGSLLSVARGSRQPAKLIVLEHHGGKKKDKPCVLVGKGITFDTGGISLKPAPEMDEMKFDMSGAGSVLGTMRAIAQMELPLNVVAIIPTCENMPGGNASRPGDIVTSMSGQTIEILNTDAEGRLILCDALTYAERFEPQAVVDIATLTGACVIALGHVATGVYSNDDALAQELLRAGDWAYDRGWQMPLWDDYQEQLQSNFADIANIGGRPAGSVTGACFLSRFAKKFDWAHLDIAGTAYRSGKEKGSTGRPVGLLTHFLIGRAKV